MTPMLLSLFVIFAELSVLASAAATPSCRKCSGRWWNVHHWMTAQQFSAMFALAQAAPGPNMMNVPMIGWRLALSARGSRHIAGEFGPSSLITAFALHLWERFKDRPWRATSSRALFR